MASTTVRTLSPALLLLVLLLTAFMFPYGVFSLTPREYESMQRVLRSHGYNLICNAMATSDLQWLLLTLPPNASFTIFAPTDASLFALDMTQTASSYTDTLRFHVVPLRLSLSNLHSLATGSVLPTLLPSSALRLVSTRPLSVSGVDVVLPSLYYSRHVAVHGLGGILSLSSVVPYGSSPRLPKVDPMAADDFKPTDISQAIAPSSVTTASPSSPPTGEDQISPAPVLEVHMSATAAPSWLTADLVAERARALLLEVDDTVAYHEKSNSISGVDQILEGKSQPLIQQAEVNKLEKCGALDEMAIDCFVPEGTAGLEHSSVHRVVVF